MVDWEAGVQDLHGEEVRRRSYFDEDSGLSGSLVFEVNSILANHRGRGAVVDANLLVLLLVGRVNRQRIAVFKRTSSYTITDYLLLEQLVAYVGGVVATPHILAQTSDLTDLPGEEGARIRMLLAALVGISEEVFDPCTALVKDDLFVRLGLTDVAVAAVAARGRLVLTADFPLQIALTARGVDAVNFAWLRVLAGEQ